MLEDSIGIVADKIKFYRFHNYLKLCENAATIMCEKGYSEDDITNAVPLKVAIPLIESATLEDDNELQLLWAQMLANAMDPQFTIAVKLRYVSLLREMEPLDVRILNVYHLERVTNYGDSSLNSVLFERNLIADNFDMSEYLVEVSLLNLIRLSCIDPGFFPHQYRQK